ncbi:hypothetical protein AB1Y20_023262 [Prymnesium parvum]|uniref:Uncharacterized protein n=1 Tax=Prymnesium parvum TaxID=97485 RepID=A0AB34JDB3_PRYPA
MVEAPPTDQSDRSLEELQQSLQSSLERMRQLREALHEPTPSSDLPPSPPPPQPPLPHGPTASEESHRTALLGGSPDTALSESCPSPQSPASQRSPDGTISARRPLLLDLILDRADQLFSCGAPRKAAGGEPCCTLCVAKRIQKPSS